MNARQFELLKGLALLALKGSWPAKGWKHDYRTLSALVRNGFVKGTGVAGVDLRYSVTEKGWTALDGAVKV